MKAIIKKITPNPSLLKRGVIEQEDIIKRGLISTGFHLPYNPKLKERAKELRKNMTLAEKKIWKQYFQGKKEYNVLRQKPIDHYIVDFFIPNKGMVIEIDGEVHFTSEGKEYDSERTGILESYGLKVVRFENNQVFTDFDSICQRLDELLR